MPHASPGSRMGTPASAADSPPAVSGTVRAGAQGKEEISDDGGAGMTHFG
jgi:hypothetical protein